MGRPLRIDMYDFPATLLLKIPKSNLVSVHAAPPANQHIRRGISARLLTEIRTTQPLKGRRALSPLPRRHIGRAVMPGLALLMAKNIIFARGFEMESPPGPVRLESAGRLSAMPGADMT